MSLFPCIAEGKDADERHISDVGQSWLQSSSFKAELISDGPAITDSHVSTERLPVNWKQQEVQDLPITDNNTIDGANANPKISSHHKSKDKRVSERQLKDKKKHTKRDKKGHSERRKKRKSERHGKSRSRSRSPRRLLPPPPSKVFIEEIMNLGYKDAYRIDKKCDKDNYAFQSLNKKHVSRYRSSYKAPYGVTRKQAHVFRSNFDAKRDVTRYYSRSVRSETYSLGKAVQPSPDSRLTQSLPPLINVPPSSSESKGVRSVANPLGILDESTSLWAQGKAPSGDNKSEDGTQTLTYLNSTVAQTIASFNRDLREDPSDITLWLKLISVQDGLLQQRTDDDSSRLFTEQIIHEKKISIVNQALNKNPSSLTLKLKHLELCGKTMDWQEINEEWKKLTFTHINDVGVWKGYLNHVKTSFSKFTVGLMMKAYTKCLKSLRQVSLGMLKSHLCKPNTVESMIEILLELCDLLHLASCTEKAVAIAQAMIEFNLHRPLSLDDHETAIQSFQQFYDSGVPRFGEPGAKGWCNVSPSQYDVIPAPLKPTVKQDEEEEEKVLTSCENSTRSEAWLALERSRQTSHWLPWRPGANESDDDCEDPHRLVLSDDFLDVLFYIEDEKLRIKTYFDLLNWFGMRTQNVFARQVLAGVNQLDKALYGRCHESDWHEHILHELFIAHSTQQMMSLLSGEDKSELIRIKLYHQMELVQRLSDKKERKKKCKEFKNYAKSILSLEENRGDERLWLCLADCNRKLELYADMNQVHNALMSSQQVSHEACELLTLARCELWWHVVRGETEQVSPSADRIVSTCWWLVCGGSLAAPPSPSQKLLLIRELESSMQSMWEKVTSSTDGEDGVAPLTVFCYALTCYCTVMVLVHGQAALEQALHHWSPQLSEVLRRGRIDKRRLADYYTGLVAVLKYVQKHLYQSCTPLLRSVLQTAISEVPSCTTLLDDYLSAERSAHVVTRLRQFFTSSLVTSAELSDIGGTKELLAVHSVLFELERLQGLALDGEKDGGINNRIRSLCEKCLSTICPNSVLLWRLYMYHEATYGIRHKLESIFYAAIQACPYAKCIYTDGISYMGDKLIEIVDIAEEKEVRVHTPLDELDILIHND